MQVNTALRDYTRDILEMTRMSPTKSSNEDQTDKYLVSPRQAVQALGMQEWIKRYNSEASVVAQLVSLHLQHWHPIWGPVWDGAAPLQIQQPATVSGKQWKKV